MDIHGAAILDYYKGDTEAVLTIHNSYGEAEEMAVEVYFREHPDFTEIENQAIMSCRGHVLDVGAGAGAISLFLQSLGFDVTALENSPGCVETLRKSGMKQVVASDFYAHSGQYDTLLLMMNGLGMVGKIDRVKPFLGYCRTLLRKGGQLILDSSDIDYLYDGDLEKPQHYYGEIQYQFEYKNQKGDWFEWLYLDPATLTQLVEQEGLMIDLPIVDANDQFLAIIEGF